MILLTYQVETFLLTDCTLVFSLANWLLKQDKPCLGTIMSNKKGTPAELKDTKDRDEKVHRFFMKRRKKDWF